MSTPFCKCIPTKLSKNAISYSSANYAREYWCCQKCNFFQWADKNWTYQFEAGPKCQCGMPSAQKTSKTKMNPDRKFWTCSSTSSEKCGFFKWIDEGNNTEITPSQTKRRKHSCKKCGESVDVETVRKKTANEGRKYYKCKNCEQFEFLNSKKIVISPNVPGSCEYLVDIETLRILQKLFYIEPGTFGFGSYPGNGGVYDFLKVVCAWKILNASKSQRFCKFKSIGYEMPSRILRNPNYIDASNALPSDSCLAIVQKTGEITEGGKGLQQVRLIHGTSPQNLYSILFDGLDPEMARYGRFGKGVYFAEDAAKVDQYLTKDEKWVGNKEGSDLQALHKKLYDSNIKHPGDVYYALVCLVLLDAEPVETEDGHNSKGPPSYQEPLFPNSSEDCLKYNKHSLVAEPADEPREFVVFQPDAIQIEYLVALKRVRNFCECGFELKERTVVTNTKNKGRKILLCPVDSEYGCGFMNMVPFCECGKSAEVAYKTNGEKYYRCGRWNSPYCSYKQWNFP